MAILYDICGSDSVICVSMFKSGDNGKRSIRGADLTLAGLGPLVNFSDFAAVSVGYDYNELKWKDYENVAENVTVGWLWRFGGR